MSNARLSGIADRQRDARAEWIAGLIRRDHGNVWPAMREMGISYGYACQIRRGWRPSGVQAEPIPYRSRGWANGRRVGWSSALEVVA